MLYDDEYGVGDVVLLHRPPPLQTGRSKSEH